MKPYLVGLFNVERLKMNYFILEMGHRYKAWHIADNQAYLLNTKDSYTIEPVLHMINRVKAGDTDSVTFLLHKYATAVDVGHISSIIGHVLQCSPEFTYHDAVFAASVYGSSLSGTTLGIVDTGVSSFSETMSFYLNNRVTLRSFGVNKSLEILCSYMLAECKLTDIEGWASIDKADDRKIELEARDFAKKMAKEIISINRMKSEYDVLAYQGATVAYRIECNRIVTKLMKTLGRPKGVRDGGAVSLFVVRVVENVITSLLAGFKFDNLILAGDLFARPWVAPLVRSMVESEVFVATGVHPGMGMYFTYLESEKDEK
jgi:hypothetical protein